MHVDNNMEDQQAAVAGRNGADPAARLIQAQAA